MSSPSTHKQDVFNWDAPAFADPAVLLAHTTYLGHIYDPARTTNKRTGEPIRKKPSYRLTGHPYYLCLDNYRTALDVQLNAYRTQNKNVAVFVSPELWSYHDENAAKFTHLYWLSNTREWEKRPISLLTSSEQPREATHGCTVTAIVSALPDPYISSEPVRVSTGVTWWKRFVNWLLKPCVE